MVDSGIGLQEIDVGIIVQRSAAGRDNAGGDRLAEAEGVADCENGVSH